MGVHGAATYFHDASLVLSPPSRKQMKHHAWDDVFRCDHLLVELNCLLHLVFRKARELLTDFIPAVKQSLKSILQAFSPRHTITLVFDGVAPLGKLQQQRQRREKLPVSKSALTSNFTSSKISFFHEEITTGSPFLWVCEKELEALVPSIIKELYLNHEELKIFWSGSSESGEGEVKISSFLNRFYREGIAMKTDSISIVGNDSDLVFVGLLATFFEKIFVVHPTEFAVTSLPILLEKWRTGLTNPPLPDELLRTYRLDFSFIMFLSGTDYYPGIGMADAKAVWSTYRHLRSNGGYYKQALIDVENGWEINIGFLRVLLSCTVRKYTSGKRGKYPERKCSSEYGKAVLTGAMWGLQTFAKGNCVNMNFLFSTHHLRSVSLKSLEKAAQQPNVALDIDDVQRTPEWVADALASNSSPLNTERTGALLTPFEQYICVLGARGRYSPAVFAAVDRFVHYGHSGASSPSTKKIVESVKQVTSAVSFNTLFPHEQEMMTLLNTQDNSVLAATIEA